MSITTPALSGSESVVGIVRESTWGTTPTSGADPDKVIDGIIFFPVKEEGIEAGFSAEEQLDDMSADREISRIIENGSPNEGSMRFTPGPETIGYFLTMIFGSPDTTELAAPTGTAEGAYQHVWYPGQNARTGWPAPYSIESIFAAVRSKLIRGALCRSLNIDIPNNGPAMATGDFMAKNTIWLGTKDGAMGSGTTNSLSETRPAVMTAEPTLLEETPWHFKQIKAYPQIDDVDIEEVLSINPEFSFPGMEGLFTGGSGLDLGTYRVDNFKFGGRAVMLFENETYWEKFKRGAFFKLEITLQGDVIQGAHRNSLEIIGYSCKANSNATPNRVGNLTYDFAWTARKDPTEGKSCQITLINTVSSYAA